MQFQSDILGIEVGKQRIGVGFGFDLPMICLEIAEVKEATALGAAYAAGLALGVWKSTDELQSLHSSSVRYKPGMPREGTIQSNF